MTVYNVVSLAYRLYLNRCIRKVINDYQKSSGPNMHLCGIPLVSYLTRIIQTNSVICFVFRNIAVLREILGNLLYQIFFEIQEIKRRHLDQSLSYYRNTAHG